jgi:uncharacterized protein
MVFELFVIVAGTFVAGLLHGGVGFGFGLIAVSLLSLALDVKEASIVLVLGGLGLNASLLLRLRTHFHPGRITPFLVAAVVGVPLGVLFLVQADTLFLTRFLGLLLLISAVQRIIPHLAKHRWHPVTLGIPSGLFAGSLAGAFGTGGPPAIAFVASQNFDRLRWAASMQAFFGITALTRLASLTVGGVLDQRLLLLSLAGAAGAVAGGTVGLTLLRRMSPKTSKFLIAAMLFALGAWFLLKN